jgi:hypothetical protein
MPALLNRHAVRAILDHLDGALAAIPAGAPDWASPGWNIRQARIHLLDAALADIEIEPPAANTNDEHQEAA